MYHFTDRSTILGNHQEGVSTRFIAEKIEFQIDKCHCSPTYLPFHHLPDQTKLANGLGADKQDQKTILHIPSICFPSNPDASSFIIRFLLYQVIVDSVEFYFWFVFFLAFKVPNMSHEIPFLSVFIRRTEQYKLQTSQQFCLHKGTRNMTELIPILSVSIICLLFAIVE